MAADTLLYYITGLLRVGFRSSSAVLFNNLIILYFIFHSFLQISDADARFANIAAVGTNKSAAPTVQSKKSLALEVRQKTITHRQTLNLSVCYLKISGPMNRLRSFRDQFVR